MRTVLLYSGGLDSTTLLYWLRARGDEVLPLLVRYGQRHARELEAGHAILAGLGLRGVQVGIDGLTAPGCCLIDAGVPVPRGVPFNDPTGQLPTVLFGRNLLLLALAYQYAQAQIADAVAFACHQGDLAAYPDCREYFVRCAAEAMDASGGYLIELLTPFSQLSKRDVVRLARSLGVPIGKTWSCYCGSREPCGGCGACLERQEALA